MRTSLTVLSTFLFLTATAQVDINKMIQKRMQQQQSGQPGQSVGGSMVDDNDPFVPNTFIGSFRMEMHFFKDGAEQKGSPNNMYYSSNEGMTLMHSSAAERPGQEMKKLPHGPERQVDLHLDDGWQRQEDGDEEPQAEVRGSRGSLGPRRNRGSR